MGVGVLHVMPPPAPPPPPSPPPCPSPSQSHPWHVRRPPPPVSLHSGGSDGAVTSSGAGAPAAASALYPSVPAPRTAQLTTKLFTVVPSGAPPLVPGRPAPCPSVVAANVWEVPQDGGEGAPAWWRAHTHTQHSHTSHHVCSQGSPHAAPFSPSFWKLQHTSTLAWAVPYRARVCGGWVALGASPCAVPHVRFVRAQMSLELWLPLQAWRQMRACSFCASMPLPLLAQRLQVYWPQVSVGCASCTHGVCRGQRCPWHAGPLCVCACGASECHGGGSFSPSGDVGLSCTVPCSPLRQRR